MFIDNVRISVKAGNGARGCQSFHRDMYHRYGIPNGGDGGAGADVIIRADRHLHTLLDFKYKSEFRAKNGALGSSNHKKGKDAPVLIIRVPMGTVIKDANTGCILRDLSDETSSVVMACGGRGGLGNRHKRDATEGEPGEEKKLILDLKLIADVGLVGFPNSGKSTLISAISSAHPKIAAYPFTTKEPALGVVDCGDFCFTVADIPGLIEDSHKGKGLGDQFLRHVERTKILVHLVDMAAVDCRNPLQDFKIINKELKSYSKEVVAKPQLLAANKMDLVPALENLKKFRKAVKRKIYPISALKKQGLEDLIEAVKKQLQKNSH
jgi:GTP-binding protein